MASRDMGLPLEGLKVIDATQMLSGPLASMYLGDLGAEVVKIERPDTGDFTRHYPALSNGMSGYFASLNRNKESITLDLRQSEGLEILFELIEKADVFLENYKHDTVKKLGIEYEDIKERNPEIIYCSIKAFGKDSPYEGLPAFDLIMQGMGGVMSMTGQPDGQPLRSNVPIGDIAASMFATQTILAALFSKYKNNKQGGEFIEVAMLDTLISWLGPRATNSLLKEEPYPKLGNRHPSFIPYDLFETKNGYINIGVASESFWSNFCEAINQEHLIEDPRFDSFEKRRENENELYAILEDVFDEKTTEEWFEIMREHGVPSGPVYDTLEMWNDPYIDERELLKQLANPSGNGTLPVVGYPVTFESHETTLDSPPQLGENSEEILKSLGFSKEEISRLRDQQTI